MLRWVGALVVWRPAALVLHEGSWLPGCCSCPLVFLSLQAPALQQPAAGLAGRNSSAASASQGGSSSWPQPQLVRGKEAAAARHKSPPPLGRRRRKEKGICA
ncbi:hypothetical protein E2562_037125 [Oryza meyeriana var. granulata]|uniref:Secreted protein n=1 Tax=Oryza meyeriana var. granulata TaxID=110450 RepID=A0A6G1F215_9ORYZ|nr:hypothetical protein E2562_037125 [Oryza meyeriana var. granulata]